MRKKYFILKICTHIVHIHIQAHTVSSQTVCILYMHVSGIYIRVFVVPLSVKYDCPAWESITDEGIQLGPRSPSHSSSKWLQHYIRADQIFINVCSSRTNRPVRTRLSVWPRACSLLCSTQRENERKEMHISHLCYLPKPLSPDGEFLCWLTLQGSDSVVLKGTRRRSRTCFPWPPTTLVLSQDISRPTFPPRKTSTSKSPTLRQHLKFFFASLQSPKWASGLLCAGADLSHLTLLQLVTPRSYWKEFIPM